MIILLFCMLSQVSVNELLRSHKYLCELMIYLLIIQHFLPAGNSIKMFKIYL